MFNNQELGTGDYPLSVAVIDLDGDPDLDLVVANASSDNGSVLLNNGDGAPDECECLADLDGDGIVGAADLAILLGSWGPCEGRPADFNGDNVVDASDPAQVLGAWGMRP